MKFFSKDNHNGKTFSVSIRKGLEPQMDTDDHRELPCQKHWPRRLAGYVAATALVIFLVPAATAGAIEKLEYEIALTKDPERSEPAHVFNCRETVYARFTWKKVEEGIHTVTTLWFNPQGEVDNEHDQQFLKSRHTLINWTSLKFQLPKPKRNILGADLSHLSIVGEWEAKFFLDGEILESQNFLINCD